MSHPDTGEEEWQAVREPLMTGLAYPGSKVHVFERTSQTAWREKYAFATSSCTTGLRTYSGQAWALVLATR